MTDAPEFDHALDALEAQVRPASAFAKWLDTFVDEKGLDTAHIFEVPGAGQDALWSMPHAIPLAVVIEAAQHATAREQAAIKDTLVRIDFANGDPMHFFDHLARGLVAAGAA